MKYRAVTVGLERNDQSVSNSLEVVQHWATETAVRHLGTTVHIYETSEKIIESVIADATGVHTKEY